MKSIIKYLYVALFLGIATLSSCSDDDPTQEEPKHEQPDKPNDDTENSNFNSKILGEWGMGRKSLSGGTKKPEYEGRIFFDKDSIIINCIINWNDLYNNDTLYSIVKGIYTINDDSLKIEWKNAQTDSIVNLAFTTLYLAGTYKIDHSFGIDYWNYDQLVYTYSVFDITGEKLSGPHKEEFEKPTMYGGPKK
ncbi:MAG: hypothetical protein HDS83_04025 [Bacteroidales bacterium]|nr:hypothetical protein [Bacteroidales bacterium]